MKYASVKPVPILGVSKPRVETPNPAGKSAGSLVADFSERLGVPLLEWQKHLFDHALKLDRAGKFRHTEVASIVSRQQGKTHASRIRVLAGLFLFGEESIVLTAQDRNLARDTFGKIVEIVERTPELLKYVKTIRWANGQEELTLKTGQRVRIVAPTPSAARGYANDLVLIDEVREQTDFDLWAAIRPTINTRRNATKYGAQVWLTSNAGHADSVLLLQKRQQALELIEKRKPGSLAWLEWSAPADVDIYDPVKAWAPANPALGYLLSELDLQAALPPAMPEAEFRTEFLCQFVGTMDTWLPVGAWEACEAPEILIPDSAYGRVFFGIDRAPSWDSVSVVAVVPVDDRLAVEVVKHWDSGVSEDQLLAYVSGLYDRWSPQYVAADDLLLGDFLTKLNQATGVRVHRVRGGDVQRACSNLYQNVVNGRVAHNGDELLKDHVLSAARKEIGESWRLSRRHSSRHIDGVMALAAAAHAESLYDSGEFVLPSLRK